MKVTLFLTVFVILNSYCTARGPAPYEEFDTFDSIPVEQDAASDFDSDINEDVSDIKEQPADTVSDTDDNFSVEENKDKQLEKPMKSDFDSLMQDQDTSINNDQVQSESSCVCATRVQAALITALESCINVLKAQESCSSRKKRASDTADIMSSCSCSQKVNGALIRSLKSCTEALEDSAICSSAKYSSCAAIKQAHPSSKTGYHNLLINGRSMRVYCNMGTLCRTGGGWTRLAYLDMKNSSTRCPSVSRLSQYTANGVRLCGRSNGGAGCASIRIPSHNVKYSQVCGRVRGYEKYTTDVMHASNNINQPYVDGISVTRGSPRHHIWTLAAGACTCRGSNPSRPSFVGNDYYCEDGGSHGENKWHTSDPLWDGKTCSGNEAPCCPSTSLLPWFKKNIGTTTTDYIEIRVCANEATSNENVAFDQYEFYVK